MTLPDYEYIIGPDVAAFPTNAVLAIRSSLQQIDERLFVTDRQLRPTDPNEAIGVFPMQWNPQQDSIEMRGSITASEPTLQTYLIGVQSLIRDMDEERGLKRHGLFSKMVRTMLYRDADLAVSLRALSVSFLGTTERTQRYGIRTQRYLSNEISGSWLYLGTLEFWLDTESV